MHILKHTRLHQLGPGGDVRPRLEPLGVVDLRALDVRHVLPARFSLAGLQNVTNVLLYCNIVGYTVML